MKGVLLVNIGSPASLTEMKYFLKKMFDDKAIIPALKIVRIILSSVISNMRSKKSWSKYKLIGGSPLKESMKAINELLAKKLGDEYIVYSAYSYSLPDIKNGLEYLNEKGIKNITVIPMYPQLAYSTTGSVINEVKNLSVRFPQMKISFIEKFYDNRNFIEFWTQLINETISKYKLDNPLLIFSAHAIPQRDVNNGDTYIKQINDSASYIADSSRLDYMISFQSKIGKIKWVEPDTKALLKELSLNNTKNIIIVPISFVNENLETLYDMDIDIIPYCKNELKIKNSYRVQIPIAHSLLIDTLKDLVINKNHE